jgi:hypothetical protein
VAGPKSNRIGIYFVQCIYLGALALIAWLNFADGIPAALKFAPTYGPVPSAVLWYGALGGVLISLAGVHDHRYDWDETYWTWHIIRPFVGAAVAVIAVLIIQAGILAVGVDLESNAKGQSVSNGQPIKNLFYFLVAFLVGYREETFRGMVKRLGDVVLASESSGVTPVIRQVDPNSGPAAGGGAKVTIRGSGLSGTQTVQFGGKAATKVTNASDAELQVEVPPGNAGDKVAVGVVTAKGSATAIDAYTYT